MPSRILKSAISTSIARATINEADNSWFTLLTMNTHPLHFDHAFAAETEFGKPLVNSSRCRLAGLMVSDTCKWPSPISAGRISS